MEWFFFTYRSHKITYGDIISGKKSVFSKSSSVIFFSDSLFTWLIILGFTLRGTATLDLIFEDFLYFLKK